MAATAVVIGAGVNELVAAHTLARRGRRVLVLDERAAPDDSRADVGWIPPRIVRDLDLARNGLRIEHADPWAAAPLPGGGRLELWRDIGRSVESIRRVSPHDAAKWPEFCERMARLARVLEAIYAGPPPDLLSRKLRDLARLAMLALRVRRAGIADFLRLLPISIADLLDDWFENDALQGVLGAAGIMHLAQGPRAGGTAFVALHHHVGSPPGVFRPPRSNIGRVLREMPGIEMREARVAGIDVRAGRVGGVVLADGEEIATSLVLSGVDPKRTLLELVDPAWLDPALARAVRNIRSRGVAAQLTLTLDRDPGFSTLVVAPSLDYLERAHDDAKYGRVSARPYIEARRDEGHRVDVHVQYTPHRLADGEWDGTRRAALGESVVAALAAHAPEVGAGQIEHVALDPCDLQDLELFPEGQAYHAELALDQALWMRPVPELARYATPIEGLYLCGPAMHPGGGIAGAAGASAARAALRAQPKR